MRTLKNRIGRGGLTARATLLLASSSLLLACGEVEDDPSTSAALTTVAPLVQTLDAASRIELLSSDERSSQTLAQGQGIYYVDRFVQLPQSVDLEINTGTGYATLYPGGQRVLPVNGKITIPVGSTGACARIDAAIDAAQLSHALVIQQGTAAPPCQAQLDASGAFTTSWPPAVKKGITTWVWKWLGPGNGWRRTCTTTIRAPGVP